jgi:hypothetical protein
MLGTDNIENNLLLGSRYQVLLSGDSTYALNRATVLVVKFSGYPRRDHLFH